VVFEADYDKVELQNIVMTSFQWRHHHWSPRNVTKIPSRKFFQFGSLSIKISGYASGLELIIWWSLKKAVLVLKVVLLHHWACVWLHKVENNKLWKILGGCSPASLWTSLPRCQSSPTHCSSFSSARAS